MSRFSNTDGTWAALGVVGALAFGSLVSRRGNGNTQADRIAASFVLEKLDPEDRRLVGMVKRQMYQGVVEDADWPGLAQATNSINEILERLPARLYVDILTGSVYAEPGTDRVPVDTRWALIGDVH